MGYRDVSGLILRRRDIYEDDQEICLLTSDGGINVRAPHARRSQKTYCGRLEPPNAVSARLYRSKRQSDWIVNTVTVEKVFAELFRNEHVRPHLWPLLSLFADLFPEGESPGECLPHLNKGLQYLKNDFKPVALVFDRILTKATLRTGIAFETDRCANCEESVIGTATADHHVELSPTIGLICQNCEDTNPEDSDRWDVSTGTVRLFRRLLSKTWDELCAERFEPEYMNELEDVLYRLFHYHFEISLDTLKVRQSL